LIKEKSNEDFLSIDSIVEQIRNIIKLKHYSNKTEKKLYLLDQIPAVLTREEIAKVFEYLADVNMLIPVKEVKTGQ
jgi:hypothetical protein